MEVLNSKKYEKIHRIFEPYSWRVMQGFVGIMQECKTYNINPQEVIEYVIDQVYLRAVSSQNKINHLRAVRRSNFKCPECGSEALLGSVNSGPGDNIGGAWKSVLTCADVIGCGWQEFKLESVNKMLKLDKAIKKIKRPLHGLRKTTNKL